MRVIVANTYKNSGGAARAAARIDFALNENNVHSICITNEPAGNFSPAKYLLFHYAGVLNKVRRKIASLFAKLLWTRNPVLHSPALLKSRWPKYFNSSDADIVHLHWINGEMLSITDIPLINKPLVWTLHDMWAFCGAEHYTEDFRWRDGYSNDNRPNYELGFDLNRWVWQRKVDHWRKPIHIVTPSRWLANCARRSVLMKSWPISVIHNPIDTTFWSPADQDGARSLLEVPASGPLLLFGAMGGGEDPRKGFDLLQSALGHLRHRIPDLQLLVFGGINLSATESFGFRTYYLGHIDNDLQLRTIYRAADAMIIPSRQDNLPNTGVEALACGTPIVSFNTGGLPDIVDHHRNGYLAKAFDPEDLANGIAWVLEDADRHKALSRSARQKAVSAFDSAIIACQYKQLYEQILESSTTPSR